jgi:RNA polymerase sigma factor (sigma-70 family)
VTEKAFGPGHFRLDGCLATLVRIRVAQGRLQANTTAAPESVVIFVRFFRVFRVFRGFKSIQRRTVFSIRRTPRAARTVLFVRTQEQAMQISVPVTIGNLQQHRSGGLTDGQLLARFVAVRDEDAFAALMHRHGPMVMSVCRRVLGNVHDAEDAFQASFLILARKAATVMRRGAVGCWLHAVAYNTAVEAVRANARRRALQKEVIDMPQRQVTPVEIVDWRPLLDQELTRLPEKYRSALVVCDLEGKSRKEAAAALGVGEGTLASRLARGRALMARKLASRGVALSGATLAALVAAESASAHVPATLVISTARVAALATIGPAALTGAISGPVVMLMEGVLKTMFLSKLKTIALLTLVLIVAASIAGVPMCRLLASAAAAPPISGQSVSVKHTLAKEVTNGVLPAASSLEADKKIVGSGKLETKMFDVADFSAVSATSAFTVELTKGDKYGVSVTADDNLFEVIKVEKKDTALHVFMTDNTAIETKNPMRVVIAMPALKSVEMSGACNCTLKGFDVKGEFVAKLNGASSISGSIKAESVKLQLSGASKVQLEGSAKNGTVRCSGASSVKLKDFSLDSANVQLSGASHAVVNCKSMLDYEVSGASNLKYLGDPKIGKKETSGVSSATPFKEEK